MPSWYPMYYEPFLQGARANTSILRVFSVFYEPRMGPLGSVICGLASLGMDEIRLSGKLVLGSNLRPPQLE